MILNSTLPPAGNLRLSPLRAAKVSEISETTASAGISKEEQIHLHIGNPVEDSRLNDLYFTLITEKSHGWDEIPEEPGSLIPDFLKDVVRRCTSYMPRGGYSPRKQPEWIDHLRSWLVSEQSESLAYNFGDTAAGKECILVNGGKTEFLRTLIHAIAAYAANERTHFLFYHVALPNFRSYKNISYQHLPDHENDAINLIAHLTGNHEDQPIFLIIGTSLTERSRRRLRTLAGKGNLYFVETNNTKNHLSLAREAGLKDLVIRMISADTLSPGAENLSLQFILGNMEILRILETVQFELKGTPSASEAAFLELLLKNKSAQSHTPSMPTPIMSNEHEHIPGILSERSAGVQTAQAILESQSRFASLTAERVHAITVNTARRLQILARIPRTGDDNFGTFSSVQVAEQFIQQFHNRSWLEDLQNNFLNVFCKHHSYYDHGNCFIVSGSARTALSLLGFHCGIEEVITYDLGWTYEHVFPEVIRVALEKDMNPEAKSVTAAVDDRLRKNIHWRKSGAVVLNNPHNASGFLMNEEELTGLVRDLLGMGVYIIDDLSYQGVRPNGGTLHTPTVRQVCQKLIRNGYARAESVRQVITVHSLSKTDCFAGARLAVIEINDSDLNHRFRMMNQQIVPNHTAILLAYLFYRNHTEQVNEYWLLRNQILNDRMTTMEQALADLPDDRNPYDVRIMRPRGSMYPHMIIKGLPAGLSLDWLSSQLARQGIGLVPLTSFAHTAAGFDAARNSFRLTLGGEETTERLYRKMRRLIIDLNHVIRSEDNRYRRLPPVKSLARFQYLAEFGDAADFIKNTEKHIYSEAVLRYNKLNSRWPGPADISDFTENYLPQRLQLLNQLFKDRIHLAGRILSVSQNSPVKLIERLQTEFYKDNLEQRRSRFHNRLSDRTVHPTQMYSLQVEENFNRLISTYIQRQYTDKRSIDQVAQSLVSEYMGENVALDSIAEGREILCDLRALTQAELLNAEDYFPFLSYWGDWDGSSRPSGQGHRLVASVLIENVSQLTALVRLITRLEPLKFADKELLHEIVKLEQRNLKFWDLLNRITRLTNQLEKRIQAFLPLSVSPGSLRKLARRFHLSRDPLTVLWEHNDRLERTMLDLRRQRRLSLEYYFNLNKRLRKALYQCIPLIQIHIRNPEVALAFGDYFDLMKRFALTPRIHQKIISSEDQFAIDTTVHNLIEINEISGQYGNPGIVMSLQISMATDASVLIVLDRKLRGRADAVLRDNPGTELSEIHLVPLFEDQKTIQNIENYLGQVWAYALQSRKMGQDTGHRFSEIIGELFFAGSDLSQEVGQAYASDLYLHAKKNSVRWLAEKGLVEKIRIKLGSGEPMQRQGGYYPDDIPEQLFIETEETTKILIQNLSEATFRSTKYARFPLHGILSSGDLRTWQSAISEKLRQVSLDQRIQFLHHVRKLQHDDRKELIRITEPLLNTRLRSRERQLHELEMYLDCQKDEVYAGFLEILKQNFRQILYGNDTDIVGIHVISYFISRAMPPLRDRPTVRPSREVNKNSGSEVVSRISRTLPLSQHGSLLRAIGHNRAQTAVLGVNQLTSGLFRALNQFFFENPGTSEGQSLIANRILPRLPVFEILKSLHLYFDPTLSYVAEMERAFPAGNSAFIALREDLDAMPALIKLFQKELLRRCGLEVNDFFTTDVFRTSLLPSLHPELAVLMQNDIFNAEFDLFYPGISVKSDKSWVTDVKKLLERRKLIGVLRSRIWELIREPVYTQVSSFNELALAIKVLSRNRTEPVIPYTTDLTQVLKMGSHVAGILRGSSDDSFRQFLIDVVALLTEIPGRMTTIPIDVIRALRDVERIARIEGQAVSGKEQGLLRFYLLQIARLCDESG